MKRWLRGPVVLATAVGLWSCSGDPTNSFRGGASSIVASPSSVFLSEGETKAVIVQALDEQGNTQPVTFEVSGGTGLTIVEDTAFRPTNGAGPVEGSSRFLVTAGAPVSTSFIVSAEGVADTVPVRILPLSFPGTFSNAAPAVNELVVITAPAGFTFTPEAGVVLGTDTAIVVAVAADGSTLSFIAPPAATGTPDISGLALDYLPGLPLSLPATTEVTVASTFTPLSGTDAPGTAPALTIPADGETIAIIDGGTYDYAAPIFGGAFGNFPARLYTLDVAAGQDITVTLAWATADDLGIYWFAADGTTEPAELASADGLTAPESVTNTFAAGSYRLAIVNFGPGNPAYFSIRLDGAATPAP